MAAKLCDAVVITTPPATHAFIATEALRIGLPVFIEKPLTTDLAEAEIFHAFAMEAGLPVMVDHIHLFNHAFRQLLDIVSGLGPVLSIDGVAGKPDAQRPDTSILWDWGAHDVAMCLKVMGREPDEVSVDAITHTERADGMGESIDLKLRFATADANFRLGSLDQRQRTFTVLCRNGTVSYDDFRPDKLHLNGKVVATQGLSPLEVALTEFCHQVRDGTLDIRALDLAVATVRTLARAERTMS